MDNDALYVENKDDDKGRKRKERNLNGVAVPNKIFHLSIGLTSLPPKINSNLYFHFPTHLYESISFQFQFLIDIYFPNRIPFFHVLKNYGFRALVGLRDPFDDLCLC